MTELTFCKTPEELKTAVQNGLRASKRALQAFLELPEDTAPPEVLTAFDHISASLGGWTQQAHIFQHLHPDANMQAMGATLEQEVHAFHSNLSLNREVFDRLEKVELSGEASFEERRFLERSLRDYRRSGVDRDEETRERVRKLQEELLEIGQGFDRNIIESSTTVMIEGGHSALPGLPEDFLASHPENEAGQVSISTDPPDYVPIMLYCENSAVRKQLSLVYNNRAFPANDALLDQMLAKRKELANLLGYDSWADYVTADKMIGSGQAVADFLQRVVERAEGYAKREFGELLEAKKRLEPGSEKVESFDTNYLIECYKRDNLAFDSQTLRPYLAYDNVHRGVLETAQRLYGIQFKRREDIETWHPDAHAYDVMDGEQRIGRFYLDMWPREAKFKHAAVMDLRDGLADGAGHNSILPEAALVCNFNKPTAEDKGLMLHGQVTTFFHEFGHLMHHMLSGHQPFFSFGGFGVEWDFVEVPSQLFEEWAWDHKILSTFAYHEKTGEPIPEELVEGLRRAEEYGKGLGVVRQMFLATLSLEYHRRDPATLDTGALARELRPKMTFVEELEGTNFHAAFGHLNGYSAMYYTYMWSLVIAKDMWSLFEKDPMDTSVASAYRHKVLAKGGGLDAKDQVRDFLGREYKFDAWEKWLAQ